MKLFLASQNPLDLKAMATRRSGHEGQLTPAYDLRAELDKSHLHPLLDALAPSNKGPCAVPRLFHGNRAGTDDDHDYRHRGGILSGVETP